MKLVIFSDIHYGPAEIGVNASGVKRKLTQYAEQATESLIKKINKLKPDAAVNLGDMIEDLNSHDLDVKNLKYIWKVLQKIKVPFYSVTGNHDLRAVSREEVAEIMGYKNPTFSVNIKGAGVGYHLIFLGLHVKTEVSHNQGGILKTRELLQEDLNWLKKDLAENKLPSMVFLHYGIAEDDMKGNWWFAHQKESALLQNRNELKTILKTDKNLLAVFSGHQHWTKKIVEDGIPYYLIGSLTEDTDFKGVPDAVWFEVNLEGAKMEITEHHLAFDEIMKEKANIPPEIKKSFTLDKYIKNKYNSKK